VKKSQSRKKQLAPFCFESFPQLLLPVASSLAEKEQPKVKSPLGTVIEMILDVPFNSHPSAPLILLPETFSAQPTITFLTILAVMAFPRDAQARDNFAVMVKSGVVDHLHHHYLSRKIENADRILGEFFIKWLKPHGGIGRIVEASGQNVFSLAQEALFPGLVTGTALIRLLQMAAERIPSPSVGKSLFLVQRRLQELTAYQNSHRKPKSGRHLHRIWKDYRPVAHLWAAWGLSTIQYKDGEPEKTFLDSLPVFLPQFLSLAEGFRRFGLTFYPHGQATPVLPPRETWMFPSALQLSNLYMIMPLLEEWAKNTLTEYRPEHRMN